ncbi:ABC transporter substrate-binding protein [Natrinema salifodinae]|uniref:Amino acid/amide ABC transporter substrate-binding protein, HAAT family n=1 Tax=Natrinema salifodinae TaxID=1202768 RepID=A0A1I0NKQ4_9EURY|nr:ABC transporter substrate-binding protein [Natrinema salifodinae]SEW01902.1 amino acid/amide ABC transporter substrate-binding protein, HAAT family [Natrinema salifodinae]
MANDDNNTSKTCRIGKTSVGRRTFLGAAGAGAVATTLAGCLGGGDDDGFTIGHLAPLENTQGLGSEQSAELAAKEINDDGGIRDEDVEIVSADTRSDPSTAQDEASRLINQERVDLLVGTFSSEVSVNIMDMIAENDVPYIVTGSASPAIIENSTGSDYEANKNIFRSGPINSYFQAEAMGGYADYLSDHHGWNTFAYLADDAAWTDPFTNNLPDELESRGYDVVYESELSTGIDDFSTVMSDLESEEPDAVFRFFAHIIATDMLASWHQRQAGFGIEGIHVASMTPDFYQLSEGTATFETTSQSGAAGTTAITDKTLDFVDEYQAFTEDDDGAPDLPMYMGFNTYDAIYLYREAVEEAGTADYESDLDDIVDAMLGLDYTGTAGEISFYGEGDEYPHDVQEERGEGDAITNFPMTQWRPEGGLECVYPEQHRTADHVQPEWMS